MTLNPNTTSFARLGKCLFCIAVISFDFSSPNILLRFRFTRAECDDSYAIARSSMFRRIVSYSDPRTLPSKDTVGNSITKNICSIGKTMLYPKFANANGAEQRNKSSDISITTMRFLSCTDTREPVHTCAYINLARYDDSMIKQRTIAEVANNGSVHKYVTRMLKSCNQFSKNSDRYKRHK